MAKYKKFVSVVAYMCNQEKNIESFIEDVMGKCEELFDKCELILVNDASTDNSLDKARQSLMDNQKSYMVSIARLATRQGLEPSMNAGRDMAIGEP